MRKHIPLALGLLLGAFALAGCGKTAKPASPLGSGPSTGSSLDQAQVNDQLAANPTAVDDQVWEDPTPLSALLDGATASAIRPLHWWRTIRSVDRTFDTRFFNPDSNGHPREALVTVRKHFLGSFNILAGDPAGPDSSHTLIRKPLDDQWERRIVLWRVRSDSSGMHSRWRIVGTSGAQVTSQTGDTRIASVRIQAGALDTTVTDPLQLHRLRRVFIVPPDTKVTVTVTTQASDDLVFFYHHDGRFRCRPDANGNATMSWTTGDFPGLRCFGVDAIAHGTLFDDQAPYSSQAWLLPFAVRGPDAMLANF